MKEILATRDPIDRSEDVYFARRSRYDGAILVIAALIFLGCIISPPSLMDDVDAAHGQLARNMLRTGDWIIPRLDGVAYLEKPPLPYWMIAIAYRIFGVHDWVARLPFALAAILLCLITGLYGAWAFGRRAGFYAGLALATCIGLFLFTRILIPDVMVALCVCVCFASFQRALNEDGDEPHPRRWAALLAAAAGVGVMLKGLVAVVIPLGGMLVYLAVTRQLFVRETWRRLHLVTGVCIFLAVAAPWHVLAALRMPPYLDFTMHSAPGEYHGFFWFYFLNEHVFRFLGLRYPHDYNTVPRAAFWLFTLLWLFPWSAYLPAAARLSYRPVYRAGRTRLLALCWIGFLMVFFTFSTTQEYYSMPTYPALALLLGCAIAAADANRSRQDQRDDRQDVITRWVKAGTIGLAAVATIAATIIFAILYSVHRISTTGDISRALQQHPGAYTLSLGHLGDLTLQSFAYLRAPLALAGLACIVGAAGAWLLPGRRAFLALAAMMVLFFHASRMALVVFDPYLSSRPLAEALRRAPKGQLIVDGAYYEFSSISFYSDRTAFLLNGRINNLEYGSYAPGSPPVFIGDKEFAQLWSSPAVCYMVADGHRQAALSRLVGPENLHPVAESGGKSLFTNHITGVQSASEGTESLRALW